MAVQTAEDASDYMALPSKTGSLRVLHTQKPIVGTVIQVEYDAPVILATLPDHTVLVAEASYLDAWRNAQPETTPSATIPDAVASVLSQNHTNSLLHKLRVAPPEDVADMREKMQKLNVWLQNAPDLTDAALRGLQGHVGMTLWNPMGETTIFLTGISSDQTKGCGVVFQEGQTTYALDEAIPLQSILKYWAVDFSASTDTLQTIMEARVTENRVNLWIKNATSAIKSHLVRGQNALLLSAKDRFPMLNQTYIFLPPEDGPAQSVRVEGPNDVQVYPSMEQAITHTFQRLLDAQKEAAITPDRSVSSEAVIHGVPLHTVMNDARRHGENVTTTSEIINRYDDMPLPASARWVRTEEESQGFRRGVVLANGPEGQRLMAEQADLDQWEALSPGSVRQEATRLEHAGGQNPEEIHPQSGIDLPENLRGILSDAQREQLQSFVGSDQTLWQSRLNRAAQNFASMPSINAAERLLLDARPKLVLRSFDNAVRWLIIGLENENSAYGLHIQGDDATLGRVDLRIALRDAPFIELNHEDGPLRADLRENRILIEQVDYADDRRVLLWRGGPDRSMPAGVKSIEDIIDYERDALENDDVHIVQDSLDYLKVAPVRSLQWLTVTEEAAREYGDPHPVIMNDPVYLA
jgi:hypothetical protein